MYKLNPNEIVLVFRHGFAGSEFYVFDLSGNTAERLSSSGTVASSDMTDAFGLSQMSDTTIDPYKFDGQDGDYTDISTGLVLCQHRFYDPSTERWVTRDPFGYNGGVNLYGYIQNNIPNDIDPSGYGAGTIAIAIAIGTGIGLTGAGLDGTVVGAPVGVILNIVGGIIVIVGVLSIPGDECSRDETKKRCTLNKELSDALELRSRKMRSKFHTCVYKCSDWGLGIVQIEFPIDQPCIGSMNGILRPTGPGGFMEEH